MLNGLLSFVLVLAFVACDSGSSTTATAWPQAHIVVSGASQRFDLQVEVANTESRREQGLMFRRSLDDEHGMLFTFPSDILAGFWMSNTYIPLDIAYVASDGTVLEVVHGKPLDETTLFPKRPYRYALEVAGGWFDRHSLAPGAKLDLPSNLPPSS